MEKLNKEEILSLLGKTFNDTLILDESFGPHFILKYLEGGYGVMKVRKDANGKTRWKVLGYPSSISGCLDMIAKSLLNEGGKTYETLQEYKTEWDGISRRILNSYKDWTIEK